MAAWSGPCTAPPMDSRGSRICSPAPTPCDSESPTPAACRRKRPARSRSRPTRPAVQDHQSDRRRRDRRRRDPCAGFRLGSRAGLRAGQPRALARTAAHGRHVGRTRGSALRPMPDRGGGHRRRRGPADAGGDRQLHGPAREGETGQDKRGIALDRAGGATEICRDSGQGKIRVSLPADQRTGGGGSHQTADSRAARCGTRQTATGPGRTSVHPADEADQAAPEIVDAEQDADRPRHHPDASDRARPADIPEENDVTPPPGVTAPAPRPSHRLPHSHLPAASAGLRPDSRSIAGATTGTAPTGRRSASISSCPNG